MATSIPLNTFRLVTDKLDGTEKVIYTAPPNIASILLSVQIANLSSSVERITAYVERYNEVNHYNVTQLGNNYTASPTIRIGNEWTSGSVVNLNEQYFYGNNLYTIIKAGITGGTPPTHTNGSAVGGTSILSYAGVRARATASVFMGQVNNVYGINTGSGYIDAPIVYIVDPSGSGASASAHLTPIVTELVVGASLPPNDSINPIMGKLVLEQFNKFIVSGSANCNIVVSLLETANE